jgi:hypothetical protein
VTIRAYDTAGFGSYVSFGAQDRFARHNATTLDTHFRAWLYLFLVNRWIDIRSDALVV